MEFEKFNVNITLFLTVEQLNQLSELTRLRNEHMVSEGHSPSFTECSYLEELFRSHCGKLLSDELAYYHGRLNRNAEAGDVPARNPAPEAAPDEPEADGEEEEPETVSNPEEASVDFTFSVTEGNMIHNALSSVGQYILARRFPHMWLFPVEDESLYNAVWEGDTPMTLTPDECKTISDALYARGCSQADAGYETIANEHFDLARRIADAPHTPEEEPETLITVRDASGVVRKVTLDEVEEMREAAQGIYAGEPPEPQMEDYSDSYIYYLEHGHWPPDDEVLAGADVPRTGDYGLSDCLVVTQSTLDFVDAFFRN